VFDDPAGAGNLPAVEVDGEQGGVVRAGGEREPRSRVEGEAVAAAAAGRPKPAGVAERSGVDGGEIAVALHGDPTASMRFRADWSLRAGCSNAC